MYNFQSDYLEGCAPEILEELIKTNNKHYGNKFFLYRENQQETEKQDQVTA